MAKSILRKRIEKANKYKVYKYNIAGYPILNAIFTIFVLLPLVRMKHQNYFSTTVVDFYLINGFIYLVFAAYIVGEYLIVNISETIE